MDINQRLANLEQLMGIFKQFSESHMQATTDIHKHLSILETQIASVQKDIALIKENLVALSSKRH